MSAITAALRRTAQRAPTSLALASPQEAIALSWADLEQRVLTTAELLDRRGSRYLSEEGYGRWIVASKGHDHAVMCSKNYADNVVTQLAAAVAGTLIHTVKTVDALEHFGG